MHTDSLSTIVSQPLRGSTNYDIYLSLGGIVKMDDFLLLPYMHHKTRVTSFKEWLLTEQLCAYFALQRS